MRKCCNKTGINTLEFGCCDSYFGPHNSFAVHFYKTPFLFLTPLLILGVLAGETLQFDSTVWVCLLSAAIVLLLIVHKLYQSTFLSLIGLVFFLLGAWSMQEVRQTSGNVENGVHSRTAEVLEIAATGQTWKKMLIEIRSEKIEGDWLKRNEKAVVYTKDGFRKGDIFLFKSELNKITNSGNPGAFDVVSYWKGKNIVLMGFVGSEEYTLLDFKTPNAVNAALDYCRDFLKNALDQHLAPEQASLAKALLLGDKTMLSPETKEAFSNAGAMHVLAISGLHVGIIMYLLFFALKYFSRWISKRMAVIICVCFIWLFVGVTGGSASVVRAALMFTVLLVGQQSGRTGSNLNTLFFSALLLLIWNPLLIFDIGFQLSYAAMLGIFLFFDRIQSLLVVRSKWLQKGWDGTALGIAAQAFTIPMVLYYFHQFPNYFWLTNLGIMVLAGVILALGMLFFMTQAVPFLGAIIAFMLSWSLLALLYFVDWIDSLPGATAVGFVPNFTQICIFYLCIFALAWQFQKRWIPLVGGFALLFILGLWQVDRYERTTRSEIVIFNSNRPVIAAKIGSAVYGFYTGDDPAKAKRLFDAYIKVMPGKLVLKPLINGVTTIEHSGKPMSIKCTKDKIHIVAGDRRVALRLRYSVESNSDGKHIDMPYLQSKEKVRNLRDGAYRMKI